MVEIMSAHEKITQTVTAWAGVTAAPHRFGGIEYRYQATREIGHLHGDHLLDIPFPTKVRHELIAAGKAEPHHLLSDSGWISFYLRTPEDVEKALELLQISYNLAAKQKNSA